MADNFFLPNEPIRFTQEDVDRLLLHSEDLGASDIFFKTLTPVIAKIHGVYHRVTRRQLSHVEVSDIINGIYGPNATAQLQKGEDVDMPYEVKRDRYSRSRYRVNGTACLVEGGFGIEVTLRTIPTVPKTLDDLGVEEVIRSSFRPRVGMVLVSGATGSGKSTLLAAMIAHIKADPAEQRRILTYEAPIEFVYDAIEGANGEVVQTQVPEHLPSFGRGVRNSLRRAPDAILIGELRDYETTHAGIEASMTGHLVFGTLHTNSVAETVRRLIAMFPANEKNGAAKDLLNSIKLLINQTLVPSTDGKRVALREFLVMTDEIRDTLMDIDPDDLTREVREVLKMYGQPLAVDARLKLDEGRISRETYLMVVGRDEAQDKDIREDEEA